MGPRWRALEREGFDPHIATERQRHHSATTPAAAEPASPPATAKAKMQAKLKTAEGRAVYSRRKVIVEPVFGQIKEARGFRRFLLRGLAKIRGEWRLVCLTHNLLPAKTTASGRVTRRASSDPACFSHSGQGLARLSHDIG